MPTSRPPVPSDTPRRRGFRLPAALVTGFALALVGVVVAPAMTAHAAGCSGTRPGSQLPQLKAGADGHIVTAHRGDSGEAPENTVPAITSAAAAGADYAEIDIRNTADDVAVLMHDGTLRRTTDVDQVFPGRASDPVGSFTIAELRRLDAGSWNAPAFAGTRTPSLRDAFLAADEAGIGLLIEFKQGGSAFVDRVLDRVALHPGVSVALGSISPDVVCLINQRMTARGQFHPLGVMAKSPSNTVAELQGYGEIASWIGLKDDRVDAAGVQKVRSAIPHVRMTHNTSTRQAMAASRAAGVDGTMTDYPARAREVVAGRRVITHEAEGAGWRVSSGASSLARPTEFLAGSKLSGLGENTWRQLRDSGVGDWIEFDVDVATRGTYDLRAVVVKGHYTGTFTTSLDGTQVRGPFASYRPGAHRIARETVGLGRHTLDAGSHRVRFTVSAAGPNGSRISLDAIELAAV